VAAGSFSFIGIVTITLFLAIDTFVTRQFKTFHDNRVEQSWIRIESIVSREILQMGGFANLLANDLDLKNSAYYFIYLEGEQRHPQEAIDRIANAFDLESVALFQPNGDLVAENGPVTGNLSRRLVDRSSPNATGVYSGLVQYNKNVWLMAVIDIKRNGNTLVRLQIGRRLIQVLDQFFNATSETKVRLGHQDGAAAGAVRRNLKTVSGTNVGLDIWIPDTVGFVLDETNTILLRTLGAFGLFLTGAIFVLLRWQLQPVRELTQATTEVGRGNFDHSVVVKGRGEVADLARAFNRMAEDLTKLQVLERQLQHKEQLTAIGRVAAKVAHDINNPLTVIRNVALLMRRGVGDINENAEDLDRIVHHSNRSISIVENLLNYGRPVLPRMEKRKLQPLCCNIIKRWQSVADRQQVNIDWGLNNSSIWVNVDPYQIEQLLNNILDNAAESCPGGEIGVSISHREKMAAIVITDEGQGFTKEIHKHLFEPFFTTKDGGTGLGLASALSIAKAHRGDIEIGLGSPGKITILIPVLPVSISIVA